MNEKQIHRLKVVLCEMYCAGVIFVETDRNNIWPMSRELSSGNPKLPEFLPAQPERMRRPVIWRRGRRCVEEKPGGRNAPQRAQRDKIEDFRVSLSFIDDNCITTTTLSFHVSIVFVKESEVVED